MKGLLRRFGSRSIINRAPRFVSRGRVFKKRLPASFGGRQIFVTPESYLRYWTHSLLSIHGEIFAAVDRVVSAGQSVWDIGANVGVVSFAAAARAGPTGEVLAVDADTFLVGLLRRSEGLEHASAARVLVLAAAISDQNGIGRFSISPISRAANSLEGFGRFHNDNKNIHVIPTFTLDWLLDHFRPPQTLKIDVEGAEHLVLAGGNRLLREVRPKIICEIGDPGFEQVATILREHRYRCFDLLTDLDCRRQLDKPFGDVLAIPD